MQTVIAPRGDARTFLTHFVGDGLEDDRYVVQRFRSMADGDVVPVHADGTRPKGRRKAQPAIIPLKAVEKMCPARDEIIVARGNQAARRGGPVLGLAGHEDIHGPSAEGLIGVLLDVPPARCRPGVRRSEFRYRREDAAMAHKDPGTGACARPRTLPAACRRTPCRRAVPAMWEGAVHARPQRVQALQGDTARR